MAGNQEHTTDEELKRRRAALLADASLYPAGTATRQDIQRRIAAIDAVLEHREQDGDLT